MSELLRFTHQVKGLEGDYVALCLFKLKNHLRKILEIINTLLVKV